MKIPKQFMLVALLIVSSATFAQVPAKTDTRSCQIFSDIVETYAGIRDDAPHITVDDFYEYIDEKYDNHYRIYHVAAVNVVYSPPILSPQDEARQAFVRCMSSD